MAAGGVGVAVGITEGVVVRVRADTGNAAYEGADGALGRLMGADGAASGRSTGSGAQRTL
jgi:hypothetical protein